ncbi:MAG: DUF2752 domain-containing protein [Akkermansiaceae bacterium]|nr:DUF2752 domain-containing protein [Akkermansiaceae bacterium]NNM30059.1 DUF2752 domain-containing protein [Akkermansiaceae bacterium]
MTAGRHPLVVTGLLAVAAIAAVLLHQANPAEAGWFPKCTFHSLTGWHCAGCGMTRAGHELLHLRFGAALALNPLMIILLFGGGVVAVMEGAAYLLGERYRGPRVRLPAWSAWVFLGVILAYWILRNVPAWPFTLLAPH